MSSICLTEDSDSVSVSLADHDRRFHKNGYRKGQKCKYREMLSRGDISDRVSGTVGLLKNWIQGLDVGVATKDEADAVVCESDGNVRFEIDPAWYEKSQRIIDRHYHGNGYDELNVVLPKVPFVFGDVAKDFVHPIGFSISKTEKGPRQLVNAASLPLVIWGNAWDPQKHHIHDIPLDQQIELLRQLDDPVAILAPDENNADNSDGFRVLVEMTDFEKHRSRNKDRATRLCCAAIGYTNAKKAPLIKTKLGIDECFSLNTLFGNWLNEYYGHDKIHKEEKNELGRVLYVNTKKIGLLNEVGLGPSVQSGVLPTLFGQSSSVKSERFYLNQMLGIIAQHVGSRQADDTVCEETENERLLNGAELLPSLQSGGQPTLFDKHSPLKSEQSNITQTGGIVSSNESSRQGGGIIAEYARAEGDVDRQREILRKYAKQLGFEYKPYDKELRCPVFYVKNGNQIIKKSADVDHYDDGTLIPLDKKLHPYFLPHQEDKKAFIAWTLGGSEPSEWNEGCQRFYSMFRHFRDKNGDVAGWYDIKSSKVRLVEGRATPETVAHEIGWHATYEWAKENHPELYKTLRKYAENATPLVKEAVLEKYGADIGADALLDEIGAERFTRENMKRIDRASEEWWDKVENGQDDLRNRYVKANVPKTMGKGELDAIAKLPPKKAVEKLVEAMISGRRLGHVGGGDGKESGAKKYLRIVSET